MNLFSLRRQTPSLDDLAFEANPSDHNENLSAERLMPSVERPHRYLSVGKVHGCGTATIVHTSTFPRPVAPTASATALQRW
jgi:hypothetical protein